MGALDDRYGVLFQSYWTGPTGREIQARGKDATILGAYLSSTRYANMIGLYELPLVYIDHDLSVLGGREAIRLALQGLADVDFAHYDDRSEIVWVVEMARIRCGLPNAATRLNPRDKKATAVAHLYAGVRDNPFLGRFHDRYAVQLNLSMRRDPVPSKSLRGGIGAPLVTPPSPSDARTVIRTGDQEIRDQESEQEIRTGISDQESEQDGASHATRPGPGVEGGPTYHDFARLARRLLEAGAWVHDGETFFIRTEADLVDAMKDETAKQGWTRHGDALRNACASEWFKHTHPEIVRAG